MVFTSYSFLFIFLPLFALIYGTIADSKRNAVLLIFSYIFYSFWRFDFCFLLLASTCLDFFVGRRIEDDPQNKKLYLGLSLLGNLGALLFFKYFNFVLGNINSLNTVLGLPEIKTWSIVLPVGISFITFQALSYSIDVYRGTVKASRNFWDFATYVALFPQLVAGPIVRYATVHREIRHRIMSAESTRRGVFLFCIGFIKKVAVANNLAPYADWAFNHSPQGLLTTWLGLISYSLQLYFDFSGYSDMAIGMGAVMGFTYLSNFNSPYKSVSISDFWRRWHISLSTWIRDYLYIALGGNRASMARTQFNLLACMVIAGVWHGANWTFAIWGFYHGVLLVSERFIGRKSFFYWAPVTVQRFFTLFLVFIGWIPFRANNKQDAWQYFSRLWQSSDFISVNQEWHLLGSGTFCFVALCLTTALYLPNSQELQEQLEKPAIRYALSFGFLAAVIEMFNQSFNPFLYFQF